jgi:hypothetical protein
MLVKGGWNPAVPYIILALLALAFISPIFKDIENTGIHDWDQFCFFDEVPRDTILRYGQFPLWNPYYSGGRPLLANPQTGFLKPTFIFTLLFGCVIGLKVEAFVMLLLGMVGMFLLLRQYRASPVAGILGASVFGMTSYFSLHIADGQTSFFAYALLPFLFLFFLKSFDDRRQLIFAALVVVWMFFSGGAVHIVAPLAVFFAIYAIVRGLQERSTRAVLCVIAVLALALGLAGIKTVPTLAYLLENPRATPLNDSESVTPAIALAMFAGRDQSSGAHSGIKERWQDYGAYVGIIALALFLAGAWLLRKRELPLIIAGLGALAIGAGGIAPYAPWTLLHKLPLFSSTHIPSRYLILFVFAVAVIGARGFDTLERAWKKRRIAQWIPLVIALLAIVDLFLVSRVPLTMAFPNGPPLIARQEQFTQEFEVQILKAGAYSPMYYYLLANTGMVNGYDPIMLVTSVKWTGHPRYRGEVYLDSPGNATYEYWSPNKLAVRVSTNTQNRLVLNQNYGAGWKVSGGKKAESYNGLLSTTVGPEDSVVTFRYLPASMLAGVLVTALAIAGIALFFSDKKKQGIACWIGAGIILLLIAAHAGNQPKAEITLDDCPPGNECRTCDIKDGREACVYGQCTETGVCRIELWKAVPRVRTIS